MSKRTIEMYYNPNEGEFETWINGVYSGRYTPEEAYIDNLTMYDVIIKYYGNIIHRYEVLKRKPFVTITKREVESAYMRGGEICI